MKKGFSQQIDDMKKSREDILKIRNRESTRQMEELVKNYETKIESVTQKTRDELMKTRDSKNKDMEEQREKFTEEKRRAKLAFKDEMNLLRDNYLRKSQLREREMSDFIERTREKMNDLELRLEEDKENLEKYYVLFK